jgi:hypothetical protein
VLEVNGMEMRGRSVNEVSDLLVSNTFQALVVRSWQHYHMHVLTGDTVGVRLSLSLVKNTHTMDMVGLMIHPTFLGSRDLH